MFLIFSDNFKEEGEVVRRKEGRRRGKEEKEGEGGGMRERGENEGEGRMGDGTNLSESF